MLRLTLLLVVSLALAPMCRGEILPDTVPSAEISPAIVAPADSIQPVTIADTLTAPAAIAADTAVKKLNFIQRVLKYFKDSNKPKNKKFDFSVLGGPYYNSDTELGIALMLAGYYRKDTADHVTSPSNVAVYTTVSTSGFFMAGVKGNHIFPKDRHRIDYDVYFWSNPRYFWGIGYNQAIDMANKSKYDETFVHAWANFVTNLGSGFYVGPGIEFKYAYARNPECPWLWQGEDMHTSTYGVGFRLQYDTRDNFTNTQKGIQILIDQKFNPKFLGNKYAFSSTDFSVRYFHKLWKGSVLAMRARAMFSYGNVPWSMLPTFGGSYFMRGYYEGRFRDKNEADICVELRQHVWRRNGIVIWGGVGSVFPKFSEFSVKRLLPNYGIGYRWEFKHLTNIRLDLGFGKGESGITFSLNEAF